MGQTNLDNMTTKLTPKTTQKKTRPHFAKASSETESRANPTPKTPHGEIQPGIQTDRQ